MWWCLVFGSYNNEQKFFISSKKLEGLLNKLYFVKLKDKLMTNNISDFHSPFEKEDN